MNDTLKAAGRIGAELGAAKAENDRLREALRWYEEKVTECRKIGSLGDNARQALDLDGGFRARDALSQQAGPCEFHDSDQTACQQYSGQVPCEPAQAQDERAAGNDGTPSIVCWSCKSHVSLDDRADADGSCPHCSVELDLEEYLRAELTRPVHDTFCAYCGGNDEDPQDHCMDCKRPLAQTEQEPIQVTAVAVMRDDGDGGLEPDWLLEGGTAELMAGLVLVVAEGDITDDDGRGEVYAAPIAQPEQQPIRMPDRKNPLAYGHMDPDQLYADGWNDALSEVARLAAAPIAQTAQVPEQSGLDTHEIAKLVREALDRQACPNGWMVIAYEAVIAALSAQGGSHE